METAALFLVACICKLNPTDTEGFPHKGPVVETPILLTLL